MFFELRPVGNKVQLKKTPITDAFLSDFSMTGFQSGTAALAAALLKAKAKHPEKSQPCVLLPAYTCPDVISAAIFAEVTPILVDLAPHRPWMSLDDLASKITEQCIAVIAINFLGIPERLEEIAKIVRPLDLVIIEDSAQGFPIQAAKDYWRGDFIVASFGRGKPLCMLGGGALFSRESSNNDLSANQNSHKSTFLSRSIYSLKATAYNLLSRPLFYYFLTRLPGLKLGDTCYHPLDSIDCLPEFIEERLTPNYASYCRQSRIDGRYKQFFEKLAHPAIIDLKAICELPDDMPLLRYPVLVTNPELHQKLLDELARHGLGASRMYKEALPEIKGVKKSWFNQTQYPAAQKFAHQLITLPLHSDVSEPVFDKITQSIERQCRAINSAS